MTKLMRAIYGPVRGLLTLPDDEADAAIKEGWAVDASVAYEIPADLDVEKATKAAVRAAEKRAKAADEPKEAEKPKAARAEQPKTDEADAAVKSTEASYQTRVSKPKE